MTKVLMWVAFALAAVFSIVAILSEFLGSPGWTTTAAMVIAGVALVVGFVVRASDNEPKPIVLSEERRDVLMAKRDEGDTAGAVAQLRMWYPQATPDKAARIVRELK